MTKTFKILINNVKVGEIKASVYEDEKAIGLGSFEIQPEYQNKGIGTKALENLIEQLKSKYDLIYCFVDKDNERAIHIYNKLGKLKDVGDQYQAVFYDKTGEYSN